MNTNEPTSTPASADLKEYKDLESDAVWELLDEASTTKASPLFAQKVMQQIRSEGHEQARNVATAPRFWGKYALPIGALGAAGIAASVVMMLSSPQPANSGADQFADQDMDLESLMPSFYEEDSAGLSEIDVFAAQMIAIEDEDPIFMSGDEINLLVSM